MGLLRKILPLMLLAAAVGCSRSADGTLSVQLVYPSPPAAAPGAATPGAHASPRAPNYTTYPGDRILIRVLAPHFVPIEAWFDRSAGSGVIGGVPPGARLPAVGGSGPPGDTGDGGLDNDALLRNPSAVKAGPDDSIYFSSFTTTHGRVRKIDRYGYISHFAGSGPHGTIVPGTTATSSPIDGVSDIDIDPAGNLYLFNYWNQIVRVDNGVVGNVAYDK